VIPNIFICVFTGLYIDNVGLTKSIGHLTILALLGLTIFTLSTINQSYGLALFGRLLFGIAAEGQLIWFGAIISVWFYYSEISFASAVVISFCKIGTILTE
jgi:hypothetical protein